MLLLHYIQVFTIRVAIILIFVITENVNPWKRNREFTGCMGTQKSNTHVLVSLIYQS